MQSDGGEGIYWDMESEGGIESTKEKGIQKGNGIKLDSSWNP